MGRTQVAICLFFFFFASACEAADCGSYTDVCPKDTVSARAQEAGHKCAGSTCTEAECCGKECRVAFIGKCAATQQVVKNEVYYGAYNWSYVGDYTDDMHNVDRQCCITSCSSAKKITCPSGKSMKTDHRCKYTDKDNCAKEDECCEKTTCFHSTCKAMEGGNADLACSSKECVTECAALNGGSQTAAAINACATCFMIKGSDKTGCYNCLKCADGLYWGGKMTVAPPASGTASSAWSSRCLASALLVGGGFFGMMA